MRRCTATWPAVSRRIKDCSKTLVYRLASYRNCVAPVIPERVIDAAAVGGAARDQKDSDSLPPYDVLDAILEAFIEEDLSVDEIAALGFDRATVVRVLEMVKRKNTSAGRRRRACASAAAHSAATGATRSRRGTDRGV